MVKPSTRARYESLMRCHIQPRWGATSIRAVNVADVWSWFSAMRAKGLAASNVRQAYRVLSLILEHAVRADGFPATRPAAHRSPQLGRGTSGSSAMRRSNASPRPPATTGR
jgi:hypothetical protein